MIWIHTVLMISFFSTIQQFARAIRISSTDLGRGLLKWSKSLDLPSIGLRTVVIPETIKCTLIG